MTRTAPFRALTLPALLCLALTTTAMTPLGAYAQSAPPAAVQQVDPAKGMDFAQNHSDITPDPAVRFGKLANGMTYAILKNATPPGTASLRMRVNAGSLMEGEDQRGLAHFLEHMAFNGSKNVPEGEMIKILQRHGLEFGPDTNAYTSFDETVYQLDLPKAGKSDLDTGLFLLREAAGNLLLESKAIDDERGIILGEERARTSPAMKNYIAWSKLTYPGQKLPERLPIGLPEIISKAPREAFADLYRAFYRPEQTTLVAVGDFDVDAIEADIKAKFSDWAPAAAVPLRVTDFGAYTPKGPTFGTYSEPGLRDQVSLTWTRPFTHSYQTWGTVAEDFVNSVRTSILNDRFERRAQQGDAPFAAASVARYDMKYTAELTQLSVTPKPGQTQAAFEQAYTLLRQYAQYGATQDELDRALADADAAYKAAMQGAATRDSRSLADGLTGAVSDGDVFTSPGQDYAAFTKLKPMITLAVVNAGLAELLSGDGPVVWHSAPDLGGFDKAALAASYQTVSTAQVEQPLTKAAKTWPYTSFGKATAVVERKAIEDLGIVQMTYANGVKVTLKSTDFKADEIGITVRFAGGLDALSPTSRPPVFQASAYGVFDGGLGQLEAADIKDSLSGKIYGIDFDIGEDSTTLRGGTTKADFATQMQVLMAFTTDSAYRPDAWERLKAFIPGYYASLASTPRGVFQMNADQVLRSGDPRFGIPTQAQFQATTIDQVKALIDTQLKTQPVEITIVGDITEDEAKAQLAQTFATLAPRQGAPEAPDSDTVKFPAASASQVFEHAGRDDQGLSYIAWPASDFFSDTRRARGLEMLTDVMSLRLTDEVREKQALAYSPNAGSYASNAFTGYGYISVSAEVKPDQAKAFHDTLVAIVTDLKTKPISDDELLRARKPVLDRLENDLKTNAYWNRVLPGTASDSRRLDSIRSRRAQLMSITPQDLQTLAATYLDMSKAVTLQVKPAAKAP